MSIEAKDDYSGGDKVLAADLNQNAKNSNDGAGMRDTILMGETFTGATTPQPSYVDTSDDKLYRCDADDSSKLEFIGFVLNSGNDTDPAEFQGEGIVRGFTGLDVSKIYYVQDAVGTIGVTPGTYILAIGIAISATEILIKKDFSKYYFASDKLMFSADTEETQATGLPYTKQKEIRIIVEGTIKTKFDLKSSGANSVKGRVYVNGVAQGAEHEIAGTVYTTCTDNSISVSKNDLVQLYIKTDEYAVTDAWFKNFRLYFSEERGYGRVVDD